jgi:hypothetical protein
MEPINLPIFSDYYSVDQSGVVYSSRTKKALIGKTDRYGYKVVLLCVGGKRKHATVHRLVALTFIPNPENKPTVNHKDGNKQNNNVDNLEWASFSENNQHRFDAGLVVAWNKGVKNCYSSDQLVKMSLAQKCKPVKSIDKSGNEVKYLSINDLIRSLSLDKRTVQRVLNKEKHFKTIRGLRIEYL